MGAVTRYDVGATMNDRRAKNLAARLRGNLSVTDMVQMRGSETVFLSFSDDPRLLSSRNAFDTALVACQSEWNAALEHGSSEEAQRTAFECAGQYAGGDAFLEYQMCMGRSNKSRCREDYELMKRHVSQAQSRAEASPTRKLVQHRCGPLDREHVAGPMSFGRWLECMVPVCDGPTQRALQCLEDKMDTNRCRKQVLQLVQCAMHESDLMF